MLAGWRSYLPSLALGPAGVWPWARPPYTYTCTIQVFKKPLTPLLQPFFPLHFCPVSAPPMHLPSLRGSPGNMRLHRGAASGKAPQDTMALPLCPSLSGVPVPAPHASRASCGLASLQSGPHSLHPFQQGIFTCPVPSSPSLVNICTGWEAPLEVPLFMPSLPAVDLPAPQTHPLHQASPLAHSYIVGRTLCLLPPASTKTSAPWEGYVCSVGCTLLWTQGSSLYL